MKKKFRRIALLLVVTLLAALVFSGCGSKEDAKDVATSPGGSAKQDATESNTAAGETETDPLAKRLSISMAFWGAGNFGNDEWYKDLSEIFNVDIEFINLDWSDFVQKVKLMATSGDMPDFTPGPLPSSDYYILARQGLLKALPDDLSAYPDLEKYMSNEIFDYFKVDGKMYTVPRAHNRSAADAIPSYWLFVRKDWMEQCGYTEDPKTWEELFEMCKAFVDRNMSGKKQTIGFTADGTVYLLYHISHSMGNAMDSWELVDGKWMPGVLHQRNIEWLDLVRKYYKAGAIDKDFAINKNDDGRNKFVSGMAGLYVMSATTYDYRDKIMKEFEKANPGEKASDCIKILTIPRNNNGELKIQNDCLIGTGAYFGVNTSDEKLDRILRMMDYFLTDEGLKFGQLGKEGRDYKVVGDQIEILLEEKYPTQQIAAMTYWMVDYSRIDPSVPKEIRDEINKAYEILSKEGVKDERHYDIDWLDLPAKNRWNINLVWDGYARIIVGNDPVDKMFNTLVEEMLADGGNEAIEEVNDYMSKQN